MRLALPGHVSYGQTPVVTLEGQLIADEKAGFEFNLQFISDFICDNSDRLLSVHVTFKYTRYAENVRTRIHYSNYFNFIRSHPLLH